MKRDQLVDALLSLAGNVDTWTSPPSPHAVLVTLDALDSLLIRCSRLVPPDSRPDTLHETARALFTMSAFPPPDIESATALVRVATRATARAHRLRSLAYSTNEGTPDHEESK